MAIVPIKRNHGNQRPPKEIAEVITLMADVIAGDPQNTSKLTKIKEKYGSLGPESRRALYRTMIGGLEIPKSDLEPTMRELLRCEEDTPSYGKLMSELRKRCHSPRWVLFREFANMRGGLKFLLDFRQDLLECQREPGMDLSALDSDLTFVLNALFQQGFLSLEEITLDSPYRQIKFIKEHDMVHPMASLEEMADRLGNDRKCFALYHRLMPDEPVIFIEVALTRGIAHSMLDILTERQDMDEESGAPDTAMFYSINNTQNGLTGMGIGRVIIGKVLESIKSLHPRVKNFSTLSPSPGFWKRYLKPILEGRQTSFALTRERALAYFGNKVAEGLLDLYGKEYNHDLGAVALNKLSDPAWPEDTDFQELIRKPLIEIAYFYVSEEKNKAGKPLDPVANFHISNGASVKKSCVNFLGNPFPRGLEDSCGVMFNYVYSLHWLQQIKGSLRRFSV
jgi:hypothetical protein